jgi:hypothetical protein
MKKNGMLLVVVLLAVLLVSCGSPEKVEFAGTIESVEFLTNEGFGGATSKTIITTDIYVIVVNYNITTKIGADVEFVDGGPCYLYKLCLRVVGSDVLWAVNR